MAIAWLSLDLRTGALTFVTGTVASVVLVILAGVLVLGQSNLLGAAQGTLALLYLGHVVLAGETTWATLGFVSLGVLLVGELGQWSFDSRLAGRYEASLHLSRALGIAWLLALGLGAITLAGLAAGLPVELGTWAATVGTAASLALVALVALVARRAAGRPESG